MPRCTRALGYIDQGVGPLKITTDQLLGGVIIKKEMKFERVTLDL